MILQWETIVKNDRATTQRLAVKGGWIVCRQDSELTTAMGMCFVADPEHQWSIEVGEILAGQTEFYKQGFNQGVIAGIEKSLKIVHEFFENMDFGIDPIKIDQLQAALKEAINSERRTKQWEAVPVPSST